VSFFLFFSLLLFLLLLLPVFCFFFWWGQFVWQQKKQKGNSIDKRGEKKKIVLQNILLEAKGRSQPVSSYTHLPRHQEIALVFSMVHSFCTQTNPSQKFHFPIPFQFMLKNLNFDAVFLPPKKGGSKAKNFTNTLRSKYCM
jgi:hypothetical protein